MRTLFLNRLTSLMFLACTSTLTVAQSLEIYGILDAGLAHISGLAGGDKTSVVSGVMSGSRFGIKGKEDLGGGYKSFFNLENRLELDTGGLSNQPFSGIQVPDRLADATLLGLPTALQPAVSGVAASLGSTLGVNLARNFWDRQIYLGLDTPVGVMVAGRQYTPAYEIAAAFDTTGTQSALSSGQVGTIPSIIDIRMSNALVYRLDRGSVSAALMLASAEGSTASVSFRAANLIYKSKHFSTGVGYNTRNNELGQKSLSTLIMGASFNMGRGSVVTSVACIKDNSPSGLSEIATQLASSGVSPAASLAVQRAFVQGLKQDSHVWHLGYRHTEGVHTYYTAYSMLNDQLATNADVHSYCGAYTYAFSKRTDINFVAVHFNNRHLAQAAPGQAGMVGGVTAKAGTDSNSITLGVRHRF